MKLLLNRYNRLMRVLRSKVLDRVGIISLTQRQGRKKVYERSFLQRQLKIAQMALIIAILSLSNLSHSYALTPSASEIDGYKLYAHNKIYNYQQYMCFIELINRESHFNPHARNGSMYGMVQGHSKSLASMNGYQQIDWSIAYVHTRYASSWCDALTHSKKMGWY